MNDKRTYTISVAQMATLSNITNMTSDRIEALAGGHGMVNLSVSTIANVIVEELMNGASVEVKFANVRHLPMEDIMKKVIDTAKASGADGANAALLGAAMMYLAGSAAQIGIPAGNRKLGATARMIAGVDRCGVAMIPTEKTNNKISGFPAVNAVYNAMMNGTLTEIDGRKVPVNVGGGPLYGHSALGEDYVFVQMARNGARVGTQAMMDAYAGAGMLPQPLMCALLGAAAILEIIHPDAEVEEKWGPYGKYNSANLVGDIAAKTAGLPEKLHMKITDEEYDTGRFIGDMALILKDVGGPSVIGMMALAEIAAAFKEDISGFSGGAVNAPLGHIAAYSVAVMKALLKGESDNEKIKADLIKDRMATALHPENALTAIYIITKKAEELKRGPVTSLLLEATEPVVLNVIYHRATCTYDGLSNGKTLAEIVHDLDNERVRTTEQHGGKVLSSIFQKQIEVKILSIKPGARRTSKLALKYLSFDPNIDVQVTCDGKTTIMKHFVDKVIPEVTMGKNIEDAWAVPIAAPICGELVLAGNNILNVVVPAAVAAAMKVHEPKEAAQIAEKAAYITAAIPGPKAAATKVAEIAVNMIDFSF